MSVLINSDTASTAPSNFNFRLERQTLFQKLKIPTSLYLYEDDDVIWYEKETAFPEKQVLVIRGFVFGTFPDFTYFAMKYHSILLEICSTEIQRRKYMKFHIVVELKFSKLDPFDGTVSQQQVDFISGPSFTIFSRDTATEAISESIASISRFCEAYTRLGSGWALEQMQLCDLGFSTASLRAGIGSSTKTPILPKPLRNKKSLFSVPMPASIKGQ